MVIGTVVVNDIRGRQNWETLELMEMVVLASKSLAVGYVSRKEKKIYIVLNISRLWHFI